MTMKMTPLQDRTHTFISKNGLKSSRTPWIDPRLSLTAVHATTPSNLEVNFQTVLLLISGVASKCACNVSTVYQSKQPVISSAENFAQSALLDSLFGTERGLTARGETKAEIDELITQLEAQNPTPSPSEASEILTGNWKLVYTSNSELIGLLALSRLPFVTVGDITQKVDGAALTAENQIQISVPFSKTSLSTVASLEVRSPTRLQVKFEEGIVRTPELLEDIDIPSSITVMGQTVDVSAALKPIQSSVRDAVAQIGSFISQQPDLKIPIASERAQTWLLTTFLDSDTRVMRGDRGSVYVLVKDVSISTKPVEVVVEESGTPESQLSIEYNQNE